MSSYTTAPRSIVYGSAAVSVVAMTASAASLASLARIAEWASPLEWALPVSVDLLALVAGKAWLDASLPPGVRQLGQRLTVVTVLVSVVLNALSHLLSSGQMAVTPHLVIAISSVPPLAATASVHMFSEVRKPHSAPAAPPVPAAPPTVTVERQPPLPAPAPVAPSIPSAPALPKRGSWLSDEELDAVVVVLRAETDPPRSYEELAARFDELKYVTSPVRLHESWARVTDTARSM